MMMRPAFSTFFAALAVLLLSGCGPTDDWHKVDLKTTSKFSAAETTEITGFLAREDECFGIYDTTAQKFVPVIWPSHWQGFINDRGTLRVDTDRALGSVISGGNSLKAKVAVIDDIGLQDPCGTGATQTVAVLSSLDLVTEAATSDDSAAACHRWLGCF